MWKPWRDSSGRLFRLIVARELREILLSAKLAWTFAVASLLILLSFLLGAGSFFSLQARHEAAAAENLRRMEGLASWLEARPVISLPPDPVACLVQGVANDIGRDIEVLGRGALRTGSSRYGEEPLLATFRLLDLEFIFAVVLSLFAVVLAFDAVNGEKERGTLRLVFASAVPRHVFILGKMTGSFLGLTVPLLLPILLGSLLLVVMGVPMDPEQWLRLGLVCVAGFLYVGVFIALAVFVSALTRRPILSMLALLVVWILSVLVVPRAGMLLAARTVEVPSQDEILSRRSRLRAQLWREDQKKMDQFWQDPEHQPGAEGPDEMAAFIGLFNQFMEELSAERQAAIDDLERRLTEERENRRAVQRRLGLGLARISPSASFTLAATSIAGTALLLPDHLLDEARAYQQTFERFQRSKSGGRASGEILVILRAAGDGEKERAIDPHEIPPFIYRPPPFARGLAAAVTDLGLLALYNLLFFAGAFMAFARYDVR